MTEPLRILSLGGGTQSCALALMSAAGELPLLDHIVFADTQGELPETYEYLDYLKPICEAAGIGWHIVTAGSLEDALMTTERVTKSNPTPPLHVLRPDGKKGRINQYRCSYDYKRRVVEAQVKKLCGGRGAWKRSNVEQWIGFSLEETKRMKQAEGCRCGHSRVKRVKTGFERIHTADGCTRCDCAEFSPWQINRWPLIELQMKRDDTIRWFAENGHPTPPRSACWFCPNSGDDRWRALKAEHPDLWERAVALDERNRDGGGFNRRGNTEFEGTLYWHASLVPLRDADIRPRSEREAEAGILTLFDEHGDNSCDSGTCFT